VKKKYEVRVGLEWVACKKAIVNAKGWLEYELSDGTIGVAAPAKQGVDWREKQIGGEITFLPDWTACYTAYEAEQALGNGFVFNGPGWYLPENGAMLVVPIGVARPNVWRQHQLMAQRYRFYFWEKNPCGAFNAIVNAPVRVTSGQLSLPKKG
jgi:hypothetical protein